MLMRLPPLTRTWHSALEKQGCFFPEGKTPPGENANSFEKRETKLRVRPCLPEVFLGSATKVAGPNGPGSILIRQKEPDIIVHVALIPQASKYARCRGAMES